MKTILPFVDEIKSEHIMRTFRSDFEDEDFYWHKDQKDRLIYVVSGEEWSIQYDNEIPILLEKDKTYPIKRETWHRIIKGEGDLILKIKEF